MLDVEAMDFVRARERSQALTHEDLCELVTHQMARVRAGELRVFYAASSIGMVPSEMLSTYVDHCWPACEWLLCGAMELVERLAARENANENEGSPPYGD
jgi:hypothetical protein